MHARYKQPCVSNLESFINRFVINRSRNTCPILASCHRLIFDRRANRTISHFVSLAPNPLPKFTTSAYFSRRPIRFLETYTRANPLERASIRPDSALLVSLYACHVPGWYITSRLSDADVCPTVGGERPASLIYPSPRLLQGKTGRHPGLIRHPRKPQGMMAREKRKENILLRRASFWKLSFGNFFFSSSFPSSPPLPPSLPPSCLERCSWRKRGCILFRTFSSRQLYRSSVARNFKKKLTPMPERSSNPGFLLPGW